MYRQGVLLLLLITFYPAKPDCRPAQEGQETNLTCTVSTEALACSTFRLEWRVNSLGRLIYCFHNKCGGSYSSRYGISATLNNSGSTLTIHNVSRTVPFNMKTRWACWPCGDSSREVTACDKLEVYSKPENPSCTVRENTAVPGDIESVTVSCSTNKVYPEAMCSFKRRTNGGTFVTIKKTPTYRHTPTTETPVYYRSECSVDVPVAELGEGTHSFSAFMYPDVRNGIDLVDETAAFQTVTLTLPEASYSCSPEMIQGYFNGKSASCTCSLTSDGYPKGQAQWYRGSQTVPGVSGGVLDLTFDSSNSEQTYTCKGVSAIGESSGLTLIAKFAYLEENIVTIESSASIIDLCSDTNYINHQIPITCRVPKDKINPAPLFSISKDGLTFDVPVGGYLNTVFYQSQFYASADVGGVYQVTCRVINKITGKTQKQGTIITFRKPPSLPPMITINGETYQGINATNSTALAAGYTGDMTCRVEGGYPKAHTTQLTCGSLTATGRENVATLTFQDDQDMNWTECKCTSQHITGCYYNKETNLGVDYFTLISTSMQTKKGSSDDNDVIIGVTVTVVVVLVIAIIVAVLVLRYRSSKKVKASAPPQENRYVDIFPNVDDGYEQSVDQTEGEGISTEGISGQMQLQVNQYEEITLNQVNDYDVPRGSGERQEASR